MHKTIETFRNLNRESTKTITIIKVNTIQKINFLKTPNIKKSRTYYIKKPVVYLRKISTYYKNRHRYKNYSENT